MSAVSSVLLAIDVATRKRDQAMQDLMHVQSKLAHAQGQMEQLETYGIETESRWLNAAQTSTTPELMRHHYQFMDRLTHAIGLQQGVLVNALDNTNNIKKQVLEAEFRLTSLKQVLKKKQANLAVCQNRREQKQTDEFASSRGSQALAAYFSGER